MMNIKYCFLTIDFCFLTIHRTHLILGGLHESSPRIRSILSQKPLTYGIEAKAVALSGTSIASSFLFVACFLNGFYLVSISLQITDYGLFFVVPLLGRTVVLTNGHK